MIFTGSDLAILVPTKDRPEKMRALLESIRCQQFSPGQIVIVAAGKDVGFLKEEFSDLPIDYTCLEVGGQIRQRNAGLKNLKKEIKLAALLDDDVVLRENALRAMLDLFNKNNELGAACFNVVNIEPFRFSRLKYLFNMVGKNIGEVTRAGYNTRITHVAKDCPVKWIIGGAAVWRREILEKHPHEGEDRSHYAINEDVYYSFPLSLRYPFAVCAEAQLEHFPEPAERNYSVLFGERHIRERFRLVRKCGYFSLGLAYWASAGQILENLARGIMTGKRGYWKMAAGNVKGVWKELRGG